MKKHVDGTHLPVLYDAPYIPETIAHDFEMRGGEWVLVDGRFIGKNSDNKLGMNIFRQVDKERAMQIVPRNEYPRPHFVRPDWLCLNGVWEFSFDKPVYDRTIIVPYAPECRLSSVGVTAYFETLYYRRTFRLPATMSGKRILLHFGAVDYTCRVFINGAAVGAHQGGHTAFSFDITDSICLDGENELRVEARDDPLDLTMPRGKQFWKEHSEGIFYTRTSGIWQSVWLEPVSNAYLKQVKITPHLFDRSVRFDYSLSRPAALEIAVSCGVTPVMRALCSGQGKSGTCTLYVDRQQEPSWFFCEEHAWSPETPRLFDVTFRVLEGETVTDTVQSYFGMRDVRVENGLFLLNGRPRIQRLVLDQGYWPESLLTAPTDEDFIKDIKLVKEMGFDGVRLHQKIEDPRFLYHADHMGLLVWSEFPAAYEYRSTAITRTMDEWAQAVESNYNFPSVVAWTPVNESWGVTDMAARPEQRAFVRMLYYLTKALDQTRPVIDNDGWEHCGGDLTTIHDYEPEETVLAVRYDSLDSILHSRPEGRALFATDEFYSGQPILITEFGGIAFQAGTDTVGWGYSSAAGEEDFLAKYAAIMRPIQKSPQIQGFCYTQLMDVEQEINGLLTYDRKPKAALSRIREITLGLE
ncbi:MAG: glycoside hydrolase family 2 TIM barrel-domain containing protein [Eubacteriales bacterium]|nr:glycoside hydrolase family 2 TIM barrel-domain containing protein [Eubacteriales bacterium]